MKNNLSVTKSDLNKLVAKLATKDDLKKLATKDELAELKVDLKRTEKAIRAGLQIDLEEFRQEVNEKLGLMPTKNEFFNEMDKLMKELQGMREEHVINGYRLKDHEDRIVILEQTAGIATL